MAYQFYDVQGFMQRVKRRGVPFPIKRVYLSDDDIHKMMELLREFDYRTRIHQHEYQVSNLTLPLKYMGRPWIFANEREDYLDFNRLSDMFVEETRMKARLRRHKHSPYEFFKKFPAKVARQALTDSGVISPHSLSEALYMMPQIKECTSFRPGNMIQIIQLLSGGRTDGYRVLDPSSGWGDRLMAAIATGVHYTGVDPNSDMVDKYKDIIRFFDGHQFDASRVQMHHMGFEEFKEAGEYDLVFTSPPYFDLESYTKEATQSIQKHNNVRAWTEKFLLPYVEKAWNTLVPGGFMALNIGQTQENRYVEEMVEYVGTLGSEYLGVISHANRDLYGRAQPTFVWRKPLQSPIYATTDVEIAGDHHTLTLRLMTKADENAFVRAMPKKGKPQGNCKLFAVYSGDERAGYIGYAPLGSIGRNVLRLHVIKKFKGTIEPETIDMFLTRFNYAMIVAAAAVGSKSNELFERFGPPRKERSINLYELNAAPVHWRPS